jgi:hypothetical protein
MPPEKARLEQAKGDKHIYDREMRPPLMRYAIEDLQDAQIEPNVWEDRGPRSPRGLREDRGGRPAGAAVITSAALSWVAARTTGRCASG